MEFIKELSERGVNLYKDGDAKFIVQRVCNQQQLHNILNFYTESSFPYRPPLLCINRVQKIIYEAYIQGHTLMSCDKEIIKNIAHHIGVLSKEGLGTIEMLDHIETEYKKKIISVVLDDHKKVVVDKIYVLLKKHSPQNHLISSRCHGDLQGKNIVVANKDMIFIDREWAKKGHFVQDIQKIIAKDILYTNREYVDFFINKIYAFKTIDWKDFLFLEYFYFFLEQVLQLSKDAISIEVFEKSIERKFHIFSRGLISDGMLL